MIAAAYPLPFVFEIPAHNPWDGHVSVDLVVQVVDPLDPSRMARLHAALRGFWLLGAAGGLAGNVIPPWQSACTAPAISISGQLARFAFSPTLLDERATSSLLALLLSAHEEVPLQGARLSSPGSLTHRIVFDATFEDPYPVLWPALPFQTDIDDSESETRVLRVQFVDPLSPAQVAAVQGYLRAWAEAAEWGGFALPPVPTRSSACLANDPVEHYEGELLWPINKCRFHPSALDSLVAVCATIHHRVANINEVAVE